MSDPFLEAMMHGEVPNKNRQSAPKANKDKDRFELAMEENIQKILDLHSFEDEPKQNQLLSPQMRRKKMEEELKQSLSQSPFDQYIDPAIQVMIDEGKNYLEPLEYDEMLQDFATASTHLSELDLTKPLSDEFDRLLGISEHSINAIFKVAVAKYGEEQYPSALSLFILLTVLHSNDYDYWYRAGLAAQQSEKYDLAIKAYQSAKDLNPALFGAYLFAIECYLQLGQRQEAEAEYDLIKKVIEIVPLDDKWREIFEYVGALIAEQKPS